MSVKDHAEVLEDVSKSLRKVISTLQSIMSVLIKISKDKN